MARMSSEAAGHCQGQWPARRKVTKASPTQVSCVLIFVKLEFGKSAMVVVIAEGVEEEPMGKKTLGNTAKYEDMLECVMQKGLVMARSARDWA